VDDGDHHQVMDVRGNTIPVLQDDLFIKVGSLTHYFLHHSRFVPSLSLLRSWLFVPSLTIGKSDENPYISHILLKLSRLFRWPRCQLRPGLTVSPVSAGNHQPAENIRPLLQNTDSGADSLQEADKSSRARSRRESNPGKFRMVW
jgi:hypothetical protein